MTYDYKNKKQNVGLLNNYMYSKTLSMFEYSGLPDSIPVRELERLLQIGGYAFITKAPDGELYALHGGMGGVPDAYYNPTEIVIANPALNFYKTLDIEKDGVLIRSDDLELGLQPLFDKCNTLLVENDINMVLHGYSTRMQKLISASDDKTKDSANAYLKKVIDGEVSIVGENAMFEGVKIHASANDSVGVTGMVEYHQYVKSLMLSEIGLSTNFNMKKERLISAEVDQQDDSTFPYIYNMMKCRLDGVKRINEMFGTLIDVDFGSVWALKNRLLVDDVIGNNTLNETGTINDELNESINDGTIGNDVTSLDTETDRSTERELQEIDELLDEVETVDLEEELDDVETIDLDEPLDELETIDLDEEQADEQIEMGTDIDVDSGTDIEQSQEVVTDVVTNVVDTVIDEVIDGDEELYTTDKVIEVLEDVKTSTNTKIVDDLNAVNTSEDKDNETV